MLHDDLKRTPKVFRFLYYLVSSFRLTSYRQWKSQGEPNPFVSASYDRPATSQTEIVEIFRDSLTVGRKGG